MRRGIHYWKANKFQLVNHTLHCRTLWQLSKNTPRQLYRFIDFMPKRYVLGKLKTAHFQ
jgi:hypothetical protein